MCALLRLLLVRTWELRAQVVHEVAGLSESALNRHPGLPLVEAVDQEHAEQRYDHDAGPADDRPPPPGYEEKA